MPTIEENAGDNESYSDFIRRTNERIRDLFGGARLPDREDDDTEQ